MIVVHPATRAAMTAAMPTAPVPNTAMLVPGRAFIATSTEPAPVCRPQPSGPSCSNGSSSSTLTTLRSVASEWEANDD